MRVLLLLLLSMGAWAQLTDMAMKMLRPTYDAVVKDIHKRGQKYAVNYVFDNLLTPSTATVDYLKR